MPCKLLQFVLEILHLLESLTVLDRNFQTVDTVLVVNDNHENVRLILTKMDPTKILANIGKCP